MTYFFDLRDTPDGEVLVPSPDAGSGWAGDSMRGMAVSGALARAVERVVAARDGAAVVPVRWTVDLFRGATLIDSVVTTRVVRSGRRLCLVDAELQQGGRAVARAGGLFLAPGDSPEGRVWSPERSDLVMPPDTLPPAEERSRLYFSEDVGWDEVGQVHHSSARKQSWHQPIDIVRGERATPFQWVAAVADVANVIVNWGTDGLQYINADVSMNLVRLPVDGGVGLSTLDRVQGRGMTVGVASVFDRRGALGTVSVSALGNATPAVDPSTQGRSG